MRKSDWEQILTGGSEEGAGKIEGFERIESRIFEKGQKVLSKGDIVDGLFYIKRGCIHIKTTIPENSNITYRSAGSILGEIEFVNYKNLIYNHAGLDVIAVDDQTELIYLPFVYLSNYLLWALLNSSQDSYLRFNFFISTLFAAISTQLLNYNKYSSLADSPVRTSAHFAVWNRSFFLSFFLFSFPISLSTSLSPYLHPPSLSPLPLPFPFSSPLYFPLTFSQFFSTLLSLPLPFFVHLLPFLSPFPCPFNFFPFFSLLLFQ